MRIHPLQDLVGHWAIQYDVTVTAFAMIDSTAYSFLFKEVLELEQHRGSFLHDTDVIVDVVAILGLRGHSHTSFTIKEPGYIFPTYLWP